MIDLTQLRDAAGPLWPDIAQAIQESQSAIVAERDAAVAKCEAVLALVNDPRVSKEDVAAEAAKSERQRRIDELTRQRDAAQAELDAAEASVSEGGVSVAEAPPVRR